MQKRIVHFLFLDFFISLILVFILVFRGNDKYELVNDPQYISLTNQLYNLSELESSSIPVQQQPLIEKKSNAQYFDDSISVSYSVAILNGRSCVQFSNSSAIYFLGEFCPYGRIITCTPVRLICLDGVAFIEVRNIPIYTIQEDEQTKNTSEDVSYEEQTQPNFSFFK